MANRFKMPPLDEGDRSSLQFALDQTEIFLNSAIANIEQTTENMVFGTGSVTGNGTPTQTGTVTHGLGATPSGVIGSTGSIFLFYATAIGATTFTANIRHIDNANYSGAVNFYWVAFS